MSVTDMSEIFSTKTLTTGKICSQFYMPQERKTFGPVLHCEA